MEIKGNPAGLGMAAVMVGSMVVIAFVLGVPEIFGISFRWGWAAIDRGHTEIRALTPKIATVESRAIFLAEGEELAATYDLQLSSGRARMSVYGWGWLPAIGDLTVFHQNPHIQRSTRQDVRLVIAYMSSAGSRP